MLQITLDSLVGGRKACVVAARRKQLLERGLRDGTGFHLAQQSGVFAVLRELLQLTKDRVILEDIACRRINLLFTGGHQDKACQ